MESCCCGNIWSSVSDSSESFSSRTNVISCLNLCILIILMKIVGYSPVLLEVCCKWTVTHVFILTFGFQCFLLSPSLYRSYNSFFLTMKVQYLHIWELTLIIFSQESCFQTCFIFVFTWCSLIKPAIDNMQPWRTRFPNWELRSVSMLKPAHLVFASLPAYSFGGQVKVTSDILICNCVVHTI